MIFPSIISSQPIVEAPNVFTDGSKTGCGAYMIKGHKPVLHQFQPGSPQIVELKIVLEVLRPVLLPLIYSQIQLMLLMLLRHWKWLGL